VRAGFADGFDAVADPILDDAWCVMMCVQSPWIVDICSAGIVSWALLTALVAAVPVVLTALVVASPSTVFEHKGLI
jgi:hypothetical protein